MQVKYGYLFEQFSNAEPYFQDLRELVKSGEFTLGPYVEKFEKKFGDYIGIKNVISTNTGTDALILCLKALKTGAGDEVITVANTFYATAGAIVAVGAKPVFVDCDDRFSIDVTQIERAITKKTKAILPVHWAGTPPDMKSILAIGDKHGIPVVEDACPAVGAKIGNQYAGTFGKINAFSMHPLKPLNVWGDGGMVVTNDDELAGYLRLYRNHGMSDRNHIEIWGINSRVQPVQAVVAMRQLDEMELIIKARNKNAARLDSGLKSLREFVTVPERTATNREAYQLYLITVKNRDGLVKHLIECGIEAKIHYPIPLHLQKPGRELGYKEGDFPKAEKQALSILTLPNHQFLNETHMDYMVEKIKEFYQ